MFLQNKYQCCPFENHNNKCLQIHAEVKHSPWDQKIRMCWLCLRNNTCANHSEFKTVSEFLKKPETLAPLA